MIWNALKLIFTGDSEDAACLAIEAAWYMNPKHCRELADYLVGIAEDKEFRASKGKGVE